MAKPIKKYPKKVFCTKNRSYVDLDTYEIFQQKQGGLIVRGESKKCPNAITTFVSRDVAEKLTGKKSFPKYVPIAKNVKARKERMKRKKDRREKKKVLEKEKKKRMKIREKKKKEANKKKKK